MPTPRVCQHPKSTVLGDLNAPCGVCNPTPLEKEIRDDFKRFYNQTETVTKIFPSGNSFEEKIRPSEDNIADWWLDKFLTMLPPEKVAYCHTVTDTAEVMGWNDYRRELLDNLNK